MKKGILILVAIMLFVTTLSFSQERNDALTGVTIQSDTSTIAYAYDDNYAGVVNYDGIVGFTFTVTNTVDTLAKACLEGSYDGLRYVVISSLTDLVDGNYKMSQSPPDYFKYRLGFYGEAEDTSVVTYPVYFYKETLIK